MKNKFLVLGLIIFVVTSLFITFNNKHATNVEHNVKLDNPVLVVYSTLPTNINQIIATEYNKTHSTQVQILSITNEELKSHVEHKNEFPQGELILGLSNQLYQLEKANMLKGQAPEFGEGIKVQFKDEKDHWFGIWYDPVVFCYNMDYLKANWHIVSTWNDIKDTPNIRITTMDFLNTTAGANILYSLAEERGADQALEMMKIIHPHVVRYAKFLSTPVRMVGMGEADMSIAMLSEVLKYRNDKYPLAIVYPQDGTAYLLSGVGLLKKENENSKEFIKWLLQDDIQIALQNQQLYFIPTNEDNLTNKKFSQWKPRLLKKQIILNDIQKEELLKRWVKEVRLGN